MLIAPDKIWYIWYLNEQWNGLHLVLFGTWQCPLMWFASENMGGSCSMRRETLLHDGKYNLYHDKCNNNETLSSLQSNMPVCENDMKNEE